jgi:hypothetical protein
MAPFGTKDTIAGMSWHHIPKDGAWKQAHLAMLAKRRLNAGTPQQGRPS